MRVLPVEDDAVLAAAMRAYPGDKGQAVVVRVHPRRCRWTVPGLGYRLRGGRA